MSRGAHAATRDRRPTLPRGRHAARAGSETRQTLAEPAATASGRVAGPADGPVSGPAGAPGSGPVSAREAAPVARIAPVAAPEILAPGRRTFRRRRLAVLAVVVLLVAAAVGVGLRYAGDGATEPARTVAAAQQTLLLQVRADGGGAAASVLYGTGGSAVLIPSRTIATVPGSGQGMLGPVLDRHNGVALSRSTVSDLLGIRVDAQWIVDRAGIVALVDAVDGVIVDVAADVVRGSTIVVPAGPNQRLTGAQAAAVLLDRPAGEDDVQYQPRVQRVLQSILARLPQGAALSRLPAGARPGAAAVRVLGPLVSASAKQSVLYQTLPVAALDADGVPTYRLDDDAVDTLVTGRFAGAVLPGRGETGNRVLVVNAVGTPGLGESVRNRIVPAGFRFVGSRNQTPFGQEKTVVVVFDRDAATQARARALARSLRLPRAEIQISTRGQSIADLMVVVGGDFAA
jgi:hypothetical protein